MVTVSDARSGVSVSPDTLSARLVGCLELAWRRAGHLLAHLAIHDADDRGMMAEQGLPVTGIEYEQG